MNVIINAVVAAKGVDIVKNNLKRKMVVRLSGADVEQHVGRDHVNVFCDQFASSMAVHLLKAGQAVSISADLVPYADGSKLSLVNVKVL